MLVLPSYRFSKRCFSYHYLTYNAQSSPSLTLQKLLISSRNLEFFTNGYRYLIQILPAAVVAPMYFAGKIEFGVINQSASAFNHILGDVSLIVFQIQSISAFSAVIDRLGTGSLGHIIRFLSLIILKQENLLAQFTTLVKCI